MLKYIKLLLALSIFLSCQNKEQVDEIILANFTSYETESGARFEALVVKEGMVLDRGSKSEMTSKYSGNIIDHSALYAYPAFHDAHCHFFGYAGTLSQVNLLGVSGVDEIVSRCEKFNEQKQLGYVTGRGWDNEDWEDKSFPTNIKLNEAFPNIPVIVRRIDGHAALANQKALEIAGFTTETFIEGGEIILANGNLTGLLLDNAVDTLLEICIPEESKELVKKSLLAAQDSCLKYGLAYVTDAGIDWEDIAIFKELQDSGLMKMRMNAMLSTNEENLSQLERYKDYSNKYLRAKSIKFYGDGALGSRGACLLHEYSDRPGWHGFLANTSERLEEVARLALEHNYQLCTHAIGDSANRNTLNIYSDVISDAQDVRWRIEHAQVVNPIDRSLFQEGRIIASVQPTHATSDMYWAEDRLGSDRLNHAYAYQSLRNHSIHLPLGTDFPVEGIQPRLTLYAAIARKDLSGYPEEKFLPNEGLSPAQALKGFTYDAAYAAKMEDVWGSLSQGKLADFTLFEVPIEQMTDIELSKLKMRYFYLEGKKVK